MSGDGAGGGAGTRHDGLARRPGFEAAMASGDRLASEGNLDAARIEYLRAFGLASGAPEPLTALAALRMRAGDHAGALELLESAIRLEPRDVEARVNAGNLLRAAGDPGRAVAHYEAAMVEAPRLATVRVNLALALLDVGRVAEATEAARTAVALAPRDAGAMNALGVALQRSGDARGALDAYESCLELDPSNVNAALNASGVDIREGRLFQARRRIDALDPATRASAGALGIEGELERQSGNAARAASLLRRCLALDPAPLAASNYLFSLNFVPGLSQARISEEHLRVGGGGGQLQPSEPVRRAGSRTRLCYVSPDFSNHPVGSIVEPLLAAHDRDAFEIVLVHTGDREDALTHRLRGHADQWVDWPGALAPRSTAAMLRSLAVDVIVDLAGHTAGGCLEALRHRAAPLQGTFLGYPTTTGVAGVDFRVTDHLIDPDGWDGYSSERLLRMPHSCYCFPEPEFSPPLDRDGDGPVTVFASFNNLAKVNDACLDLWARVLAAVPGSVLRLKGRAALEPGVTARVAAACARNGVEESRVELRGWTDDARTHLDQYNDVHVALDPFPYNGATTTFDALWMGVPVVTMEGSSHAGRMGLSILAAAGLDELACDSEQAYVATCARLAADVQGRGAFRATIRDRLRVSALMDARGFASALEQRLLGALLALESGARPVPMRAVP